MYNKFEYTDTRDLSPEIKPVIDDIKKLRKSKKFDEAIEKCKKILETWPESAELRIELGDLYFEKHNDVYHASYTIDDAITQYQYALEMKTNSPFVHHKLGNSLLLKGEFEKALSHFKTAIKYKDDFSPPYLMMGVIESKRDNLAEASYYFQKAIDLDPFKSCKAHLQLSFILRQQADRTKTKKKLSFKLNSLKHFFLAFVLFVTDKEAIFDTIKAFRNGYSLLPVILRGHYYERIGFIDRAIELYSNAIEKAVGFPALYISLGDAYRKLNRYEDAVNEYRMAIWLNPSSISAYKNLCSVFEEMGDYESAIKTYKKLLSFRPNDAVLYSNLANILYMKGNVPDAISAYQTALVLNPNKTWTSVVAQTLGYVFQEAKGDYDAAISAYQSATLLNPNDVDIFISLGSAFFDKGDLNNALAAYRSALDIDPNNAKVHCNMGYLLWGKSALNESIASYEMAIRLDPLYDIAYNNLGVIYLDDLGNLDKASELFQRAIEINPNYALAYYNMARLMTIKGDKIEAARYFQIAIDLNSYTNELDTNEIKDRIARLFDSD
ncbi:MAG: tetratricopeptide repeat protein [Cyanobacteriota bacterium]